MNAEFKRLITEFTLDPSNPEINFKMGSYYEDLGQYSSAGSYYLRASERYENKLHSYESLIRLAQCLISLGRRRYSVKGILNYAISLMPSRPEAYYMLSKFVENNEHNEEKWFTAYGLANIALGTCDFSNLSSLRKLTDYLNEWSLIFQKAHAGVNVGFIEEAREAFLSIINSNDCPQNIKNLALTDYMKYKKEHERASYYHSKSNLKDVYETSLAKFALQNGGSVHPIVISSSITNGKATTNPSVFVDSKDNIYVNLRQTNYTLYYSNKFPDKNGPLKYLYPDNDINLRSENILCKLDDRLNTVSAHMIDMRLNEEPNWFYMGLEDARLFEWEEKKYICGVRRDHIYRGKGRMDLSEIEITDKGVYEVNRYSMPTPEFDDTYCEKNWMPILDEPFHWVKWSNPTQVVSFDKNTLLTQTIHLEEDKVYKFPRDLKGGSQVIPWKNGYHLTITHECIYNKDDSGRQYLQRVVVWDKDWNIVCSTRDFSMMGGVIEFVSGIAYYKDDVLISFGYEDNASYILRIPKDVFDDFVLRG